MRFLIVKVIFIIMVNSDIIFLFYIFIDFKGSYYFICYIKFLLSIYIILDFNNIVLVLL